MRATLEGILFLLVGYSTLTDGASKFEIGTHMQPACSAQHSTHTVCEALQSQYKKTFTFTKRFGKAFSVWCDMNNGGGWTVFQRRRDGSVEFYRDWAEYENGFGDVKGEHWLGLKKINCLTSVPMKTKLRIDLADFAGHFKYASYDYFYVGTPNTNYKLRIGGYQRFGTSSAGDSMTIHNLNGMPFTTHDRDNDPLSGNNCAAHRQGAWWDRTCTHANLNGLYLSDQVNHRGIVWQYFNATGSFRTLRYSDMKLRRSD